MLAAWRKGMFCFLLALILSLPILAQAATQNEYGRYHALVIGNNDYAHLPKLKTAVSDAAATAELLRGKYGFEVTLLLNAKRERILEEVNRLRAELTNKDRLLIYYAGHGEFDRETDTGYWLPVDAKPQDDTKWIANDSLTRHLRAMTAHHVLVVADSCFSGTLTRSAGVAPRTGMARDEWIRRMAGKRARTAIVSGGLEPVADTGRGGHSVFANAFLSVLRENNEVLDGQNLFQRLRSRVVVNADQTPQYSTIRRAAHEGGDFLFVPRGLLGKANTKPDAPTLGSNQAELLFWNSIKDSRDAEFYQAYIDQYPNGSFAGLAWVRLKKLQSKQTASLEPAIVLEPIEGTYVAVRNANVRTAPNVSAGKVTTLAKGSEIYVPGKVAGGNWMAVDRDGKRLGYVFSNLLQDREVFEAARIEDAGKREKTEANKKEAALWRKEMAERQASLAPRAGIQNLARREPAAKSVRANRFDGHWKASLINCSTTDYAGVVSYEIELQVTKGTYDLELVTIATNYDANVAKELSSLSGTVSSDGQIEKRAPAGLGSSNILVFTADLSAVGGDAWMSIDSCRVALKAPAKAANLSPARVRPADLETSERKEAQKIAILNPKPNMETSGSNRFDGHWTTNSFECGTSPNGYIITYNIDLRVTKSSYSMTLEGASFSEFETLEISGSVNAKGKLRELLVFQGLTFEKQEIKGNLQELGRQSWISIGNCRVALNAKL